MATFSYSVLSSGEGSYLGKAFGWKDGELRCVGVRNDVRTVRRAEARSLEEFLGQVAALHPWEAVAFGVCNFSEARVRCRSAPGKSAENTPVVTRTRADFTWPDAGLLFIDYDPPVDEAPLEPDELLERLRTAVPELAAVPFAHRASSSSGLFAPTGQELTGVRGQHLFALVENAKDIPSLGQTIVDRLWLAGHGRCLVTRSGNVLTRTIVDASVWQPERLIFTQAHCVDGVEQHPPSDRIYPGNLDDVIDGVILPLRSIQPLSEQERVLVQTLKASTRSSREQEAKHARELWLKERAQQGLGEHASDDEIDSVMSSMKASLDQGFLPAELQLKSARGRSVTVAELLNDRERWDGERFADPFEPDYRGDVRIACALLANKDRPAIYSHAHGGQLYLLCPPAPGPSPLSDFEDLTRSDLPASERRRLEVLEASEFVKASPISWLIKGLLPTAGLAMIFGASGSGKSFFALDLVGAIAAGTAWRALQTKKGRVVYVAAEGVAGIRSRLKAYAAHSGLELDDLPIGVVPNTPDLRGTDSDLLANEIERWGGADLIVIDTFAQVTSGADENSSEDMASVLRKCSQLIDKTGATVLLIHHSGKDDSRGARGWSGIRAALDTEIKIAQSDSLRFAKITKQKEGSDGDEFGFELRSVEVGVDSDGEAVTSCVVRHLNIPRTKMVRGKWHLRIMTVIEAIDGFNIERDALIEEASKQAEAVGENRSPRWREMIGRALSQLVDRGLLASSGNLFSVATQPQQTHNPDFVGSAGAAPPHHTPL